MKDDDNNVVMLREPKTLVDYVIEVIETACENDDGTIDPHSITQCLGDLRIIESILINNYLITYQEY